MAEKDRINKLRKELSDGLREQVLEELTRLQTILNAKADLGGRIHPLMEVTDRVKTTASVLGKLDKPANLAIQQEDGHDLSDGKLSPDQFRTELFKIVPDVLGFRLLCPTKDAVFLVVYELKKRFDKAGTTIANKLIDEEAGTTAPTGKLSILLEKNFIDDPPQVKKPSPADPLPFAADSDEVKRNYRSYHLTFVYEATSGGVVTKTPFEIQLRTYGMQFYAQIEHEIGYKAEPSVNQALGSVVETNLAWVSKMIYAMDDAFDNIYDTYLLSKETKRNIVLSVSGNVGHFSVFDHEGQELTTKGYTVPVAESPNQAWLAAANTAVNWCNEKRHKEHLGSSYRIYYGWDQVALLAQGKNTAKDAKIAAIVTSLTDAVAQAEAHHVTILWRYLDPAYVTTILSDMIKTNKAQQ